MAISGIFSKAATTNDGYVNTTQIPAAKNTIDMSTFLQMLTTELSNQDPTAPMDDSSFFGQIAQMGTVQGMDTLTKEMQVSEASSLIGRSVVAVGDSQASMTAGTNIVSGVVTGLSIQQGVYYLNVQEADGGTAQVQMGNVQSVSY
ncbi:MAG TPA: flagellar hook capping FlgD N-terminal domain-containing protein [Fimbriimonadaceae bacterium]|nr:flagellar hook capping FlgD N-terminal domain-containing protein [Fimbriimonadaceae bacterium]